MHGRTIIMDTIIICAAKYDIKELLKLYLFSIIIGLTFFLVWIITYIDCFVFVFYKLSVPPVRTLLKLQSGTVTLSVTDILKIFLFSIISINIKLIHKIMGIVRLLMKGYLLSMD